MKEQKKPVELANEAFETMAAAGKKPKVADLEKEFGLTKNQLANYRSNQARLAKAAAVASVKMANEPGEMVRVPVDRVRMVGNSRTIFDAAEMERLKDSMRQTRGAMQPVVGCAAADGWIELIMGERRLRATQELAREDAAFGEMTVILREPLSRRDFLTWNLMENLQRANLRPSEIGARYQMMLAETDAQTGRPLFSKTSAAEETGQDENFVIHCLALLAAPASVRKAVDEGRCALETGAQVGMLPKSMHERAALDMVLRVQGPMPVKQAREWVASEYRRDLRKADFEAETRGLEGSPEQVRVSLPACVDCEWWGGNRNDVGGQLASTVCLDPRCFEAKQAAMLERNLSADGARVRMLPAAERRKVIDPATGGIAPDCGYVEMARKPDGFFLAGGESAQGAAPTWAKALEGTDPETVVVFDESGRKRVLVETAVAMEGVMLGKHASLFSTTAAAKYESKDERATRKRIASARETAVATARREGLAAFARVLRTGMVMDSQAQVVRLAMAMLIQPGDETFLAGVLSDVLGPEEMAEGLAPWLASGPATDDLWMALVLVMQARLTRLEGWASWTASGSPMAEICAAEGWDPSAAEARVKAAAEAAEKAERATMEAERRAAEKEKEGAKR